MTNSFVHEITEKRYYHEKNRFLSIGLHYSAYRKIWEAIFMLAVSSNKQIFVTTHSKETLTYLNEMLEEHSEYKDELRLYTIERTLKKGLQAYKYTFEGLKGACASDVEIRSVVM